MDTAVSPSGPKTGRLIVFEGFDGVGKSSMTRYVVEKLGFINLSAMPQTMESVRSQFDQTHTEITERAAFYLGVNAYHSMRVQQHLQAGQNVVLDRYYMSTLASHDLSAEQRLQMMQSCKQFVQPDIWFYLYADFDTVKKRLERRAHLSPNDKAVLNPERFAQISREYDSMMQENCVPIDCTKTFGFVHDTIQKHVDALNA